MRRFLANTLHTLANWLNGKAMPSALAGGQWTGTGMVDAYKRNRNPTPNELMAELKATAWTCASLNAQTCASYQPRLYVTTRHNQAQPKCLTKAIAPKQEERLRSHKHLHLYTKNAAAIEEVTDHPILDLFRKVNPVHNAFDLWELTTLYQEVHGSTYWYLDIDPMLNIPSEIWILPAQNVYARRDPGSRNIVDFYEYRAGKSTQFFKPGEIIHFRYPDPRDPYTAGLSPLRACYEQVALASDYAAFKKAKFENHAIPDAILSPEEVIGEEERARLETEWNTRLRRGGSGRVIVAEAKMKMDILNHSMGDLAALAEMNITKELIMNAFHVPVAYFTSSTNLANLEASQSQHAQQAIAPRIVRRDEKINEQLVSLYDPAGRLFVASEDPTPPNPQATHSRREQDLKYGVVSINQARSEDGLPPVSWGELPWLPMTWAQTDYQRGKQTIISDDKDTPNA